MDDEIALQRPLSGAHRERAQFDFLLQSLGATGLWRAAAMNLLIEIYVLVNEPAGPVWT